VSGAQAPAAEEAVGYEELRRALARRPRALEPAECHGHLCGWLAVAARPDPGAWMGAAAPGGEEAEEEEGDRLLRRLHRLTEEALQDPSLRFYPLLPPEPAPLPERAAALGQWCHGFLEGLGHGGLRRDQQLPEPVQEALRDFSEISRLGHQGSGEQDEQAFTEILEYVRMAALLVYEELRPLREGRSAAGNGRERPPAS